MLSCHEICKSLSKFEGEQIFKLENQNPLFEQSPNFSKNYLQLVEDKIKENGWIDPNLEPEKFKLMKENNAENTIENSTETIIKLNNDAKVIDEESLNESKDIENNSLQYSFLNYKEHQTNELPKGFLELIDLTRQAEIYYYGMKGPDSYIASILLGAEANYWLQHRKKKKEYADQLRTTFSIQKYDILRGLSKESIGHDYLKFIYSNDFPENVDSDKSKEYQFLIGYYYKINVLVLNFKELKGYFTTDWNPEIKTLILLLDNNTYLPILSNKISYFSAEEIKNLESKFNIMYPTKLKVLDESSTETGQSGIVTTGSKKKSKDQTQVASENRKKDIKENMINNADQLDIKTIKPDQIHPIRKYKLKDLQDIAEKLNLPLETTKHINDKSIRIIKKNMNELYDDIINKITSLGN
jgi:hypothetical protein